MSLRKEHGKSSTLEILGGSKRDRTPRKWAQHYKRLTSLREEFLRGQDAQRSSAREEISWFSEHMADAATDSYDRDCALALLSSNQNALYEIDEALERIRNGTYGLCELTGQPIEPERLKAIPWTRYSVAAQTRLETRKGFSGVRLGQVGMYARSADGAENDQGDEEFTPPERQREAA